MTSRLPLVRSAALLAFALTVASCGGCGGQLKVPGSSCKVADDCLQYSSCGRLAGGCTCSGGACYYDPNAVVEITGCRTCHGSLDNAAPPLSVDGGTDTHLPGVGAHQRHLSGGAYSRPVACRECHVVPVQPHDPDDPSHLNGVTDVTFGPLATTGGATAAYDFQAGTCTAYCHGQGLTGGNLLTPVWTVVDGSQAKCGACHGTPPPLPHPPNNRCEECHAPTAGPNLTIANAATHVDGVVQGGSGACDSCHGDPARGLPNGAAPPFDLSHNAASNKVGAHLKHLSAANSADVECKSCHRVPLDLTTPGHVDDADRTAEVIFDGLALANDAGSPAYLYATQSCTNTYCHGGTLTGGVRAASGPVWPTPDTDAACNACHGLPPPAPHPQKDTCNDCHPGYTKTGPTTGTTVKATHVDGKIDTNVTCATCHGTPGRDGGIDPWVSAAPPLGTLGQTLSTDRAVGAHQPHLMGGPLALGHACVSCHVVPSRLLHSDGTPRVTFGGLADAGASNPVWSGTTCSAVYCHGNFRNGNTTNQPVWTSGTVAVCGTCHGTAANPSPGGSHPPAAATSCGNCHPNYTGTTVDVTVHINGYLDVINMSCTSCHGDVTRVGVAGADLNQAAAPPRDTWGDAGVTVPGVGAHQGHVNPALATAVAAPLACKECHVVPTTQSHSNGFIDMAFGALSKSQTSTPAFSTTALSCSNTWCHGGNALLHGGATTAPVWNSGTTVNCGSCHGNPPPAPHPQQAACTPCHSAGYTKTGATTGTVDLTVHLNGVIDIPGATCTSCHGTTGRVSSLGADVNQAAAPPLDTLGNSAATFLGVGVHSGHVNPVAASALARPFACAECHGVSPTSNSHANGTVAMTFGSIASAQVSSPTFTLGTGTCANTWCHGGNAKLTGATGLNPVWNNNGTVDCTSCHGNPPPAPHPQNFICSDCHAAAYSRTSATTGTVDTSVHVNGLVDVINLTCSSCHGDATRTSIVGADPQQQAAPPMDTMANLSPLVVTVGAHIAHVNPDAGSQLALPFSCNECHGATPTTTSHSNSVIEMGFGPIAHAMTSNPTFNLGAGTCTTTWCHGGNLKLLGGVATSPVWNNGSTVNCTSCHGNPPPLPHAQNDACATCHPAAYTKLTATTGTVDKALHVNGLIDVANLTCTSCHGDSTRTPIAGADPQETAAPPLDTLGGALSTTRGVGQHFAHVNLAAGAVAKPFACNECHGATPTSTSHSNGVVEMGFGTIAHAQTSNPVWAFDGGVGTCATTWCHGGNAKLLGGTSPTIAWNTNAVFNCTTCHGNPPPLPHAQNDTCGSCHATAYTKTGATTGTVDMTQHVNGVIDVTNLTCTSCHGSTARVSVAGADVNQQAAPPIDTRGDAGTTYLGVGAHVGHVNPATATALATPVACAECHGPSPTSTSHSNSVVEMPFSLRAVAQTSTPAWTRASATCTNTWCHGGNAALKGGTALTPVWNNNSTVNCTSCHGNPPPVPHVQNDACGNCHSGYSKTGATTGTVAVSTHINGVIEYVTMSCTSCHGTAGRTGVANIAAAPPTGTAGQTLTSQRAVGAHLQHLQPGTLAIAFACTECHVVPAVQLHADGGVGMSFGTLATTRGATPAWNGVSCTNSYCHGSFANGNTGNAPSWTGGATQAACGTCHGTLTDPVPLGTHPTVPITTSCGQCHPGYTRTTVDPTLHVNGMVDGSGEPVAGGTSCGSCHSTQFQGMTGGIAKTSKHMLGGGDVPIDPGGAWPAPLRSAPLYANATCVDMCHGDHPHDLTSPVVATHQNNGHLDAQARSANRTSTTRASTDFDSTQANGGMCLSCHRNPLDASHVGLPVATFQAGAHNYTTNTQGTWNFTLHDGSNFARNCTKCHSDRNDGRPSDSSAPLGAVHYSDYPSLLAGSSKGAGAPAVLVCNNCHGNGTVGVNLSGKDTATDFAKALGHPVNADTVHDSVNEATSAYNDGKYKGANRHVNCLDCHEPHAAGNVSHNRTATATSARNQIAAGSPLQGVSGVNFSTYPALWGTTSAANYTFTTAATAEWQICFKCHTAWAFDVAPPNGPSGLVETDVAQAFNPANRSGHPVITGLTSYTGSLAPKALTAAQMLAPWNVNLGTQTMMCADCHGTDSAAPAAQGPHGSAASFMLTGLNRTWPGTFTLSSIATGAGTAAGVFCNNCHINSSSGNKAHSEGNHRSTKCAGCHIVIPHGGKVSRLIATTGAGLPARLQQTGVSVNMVQFKKAAPNSYAESNCQTNCGQHNSAVTSPETW